jgi:hypothetical protein
MNYLQSIGAVQQTGSFDFQAAASKLAQQAFSKTPGATHAVVTLGVGGKSPIVMPFSDAEVAGIAFDEAVSKPGSRAYASLFARTPFGTETGIIAEQRFDTTSVVETRFTFEKLKSIAPVLIGGAVLIAAVVWLSRREKKVKTRRRATSYRRRTTTVWR